MTARLVLACSGARRAGSAGALSTQVMVSSSGSDADQRLGAAHPPPKVGAVQRSEGVRPGRGRAGGLHQAAHRALPVILGAARCFAARSQRSDPGRCSVQARLSAVSGIPIWWARSASAGTAASAAGVKRLAPQASASESRMPAPPPCRYFPVSRPPASGDHTASAVPWVSAAGTRSRSARRPRR